ncbi:MAG: type II secretion system protein [Planctomycetia bacterium]
MRRKHNPGGFTLVELLVEVEIKAGRNPADFELTSAE